jgi:hypothetical protein
MIGGEPAGLRLSDGAGGEVVLDPAEASDLWSLTGGFELATVSACLECRSRVLAALALVDVLDAAPPHPRAQALIDLADDAPTLHLYLEQIDGDCVHRTWLDPLAEEWSEIIEEQGPPLH